MNHEVDLLLRFFYFRRNDELFVLTGSIDDKVEGDGEEWSGIIQKVRDFQSEETKKIGKMFDNVISTFEKMIEEKVKQWSGDNIPVENKSTISG